MYIFVIPSSKMFDQVEIVSKMYFFFFLIYVFKLYPVKQQTTGKLIGNIVLDSVIEVKTLRNTDLESRTLPVLSKISKHLKRCGCSNSDLDTDHFHLI